MQALPTELTPDPVSLRRTSALQRSMSDSFETREELSGRSSSEALGDRVGHVDDLLARQVRTRPPPRSASALASPSPPDDQSPVFAASANEPTRPSGSSPPLLQLRGSRVPIMTSGHASGIRSPVSSQTSPNRALRPHDVSFVG